MSTSTDSDQDDFDNQGPSNTNKGKDLVFTQWVIFEFTGTLKSQAVHGLLFNFGTFFHKGSFNNYMDGILTFFDPLTLRGQFL